MLFHAGKPHGGLRVFVCALGPILVIAEGKPSGCDIGRDLVLITRELAVRFSKVGARSIVPMCSVATPRGAACSGNRERTWSADRGYLPCCMASNVLTTSLTRPIFTKGWEKNRSTVVLNNAALS